MSDPGDTDHVRQLASMLLAKFEQLEAPGNDGAKPFANAVFLAACQYFAKIYGEAAMIEAHRLRGDMLETVLLHAQRRTLGDWRPSAGRPCNG